MSNQGATAQKAHRSVFGEALLYINMVFPSPDALEILECYYHWPWEDWWYTHTQTLRWVQKLAYSSSSFILVPTSSKSGAKHLGSGQLAKTNNKLRRTSAEHWGSSHLQLPWLIPSFFALTNTRCKFPREQQLLEQRCSQYFTEANAVYYNGCSFYIEMLLRQKP